MIRLEQVSLAPGGRVLVRGATWHLRPRARVGIVGRNGSGKTTLLRVLSGEADPAEGRVIRRPGAAIGYLRQQAVSGSTRTVWEEARSALQGLKRKRAALEAAEAAVAQGEEGAAERLDDALEAFRAAGGFREDETIGEVLHGLGFQPSEWHRPCDTFSGGWQMRIALARLLLSAPDVALLDEPTNHLDLLARGWLARYLAAAPFAIAVVSHDRYLLDAVATEIVEVRGGALHRYAGNYSAFVVERERRIAEQETARERQKAEIDRLERFVERFKAKATKASQARSRQNRLDRIERIEAVHREATARMRLPEAPPSSEIALELRGATLGWPDPSGGSRSGPDVLVGVDLVVQRGRRLAVLGANGCGKSTLLHALAGRLPLRAGRRRVGDRVRVGVFTQDLAADLPMEATALEVVSARAPLVPPQRIRAVLGALGLPGDAALRPIGKLSGGEKARVALAALVARPHNVLLLDEPTNHLDVETVDVLADALANFDGALLLVTHDRALVERVATHVVTVRDGAVAVEEGVRPEDFLLEPRRREASAPSEGAEVYAARKRRARERERARRRIADIEVEIEKVDAEMSAVDEALFAQAADFDAAARLGAERAALEARSEALYAEWETLEETLADDG